MLPNGWKKVMLGDVVSVASGKNKSRDAKGTYPVYGSTGVIGYCNEYQYSKDCILIARVGANAGYIHQAHGKYDVSDNTLVVDCCDQYDFNFAYQHLLGLNINQYVFGSGQPLVTGGLLKKIEISLPPIEEQKKIAATLSVWDSAIEKMEKFIDAKENELNIVLRQNLLEKGIALKWKEIPLTEILKSVTPPSKIHQDSYLNSGKYPIVDQSKDLIAGWTNDESSVLKINRPLIIFGDHTCALKIMHMPFAQGADGIKILSAKDGYDPTYIYYAIKANPVIPEGYKRHFSALMLKSILCPSLEEQKKYAVYFKSLDEEISLLKQQLENYKKQKQGLMQKLLTGQWRVK